MSDVGRRVQIKTSAKRYHGGGGTVMEVAVAKKTMRYLIRRDQAKPGRGVRLFWATINEFEFVVPDAAGGAV